MSIETIISTSREVVVFKYPGLLPPTDGELNKAYGAVKDAMLVLIEVCQFIHEYIGVPKDRISENTILQKRGLDGDDASG